MWRRGTCCAGRDRKSTRLNSSHLGISYAVFCLKKKATAGTQGTTVPGLGVTLTIPPCRVTSKGEVELGADEDYAREGLIYPPRFFFKERGDHGIYPFFLTRRSSD